MGPGLISAQNSSHMLPGVLSSLPGYETYSRVNNVIKAIEDAEPVAFNTIAKRLSGITLDDIKPILVNILKDIALYVGGSTVIGAGIGGAVGSLAFGAGAIPGAVAGAAVGAEVGNLILTFTGLKSIAIYMKDAVPKACNFYTRAFKEAWGPRDFGRGPFMMAATDDFARGHVLFLMALLVGIVAYLTRGKGNMQSLLAEVRGSARLGPRMATWLERNEDKLLNSPELRQPMRSEGVGGGGDAPKAPTSDIPKPKRGSSSPAAPATGAVASDATSALPIPTVTAEGEVGGKTFTDTNQTARPPELADPDKPTLISDRVAAKTAKYGKDFPNGNMADAHAEIGVIQQASEAGETAGQDMSMTVEGKDVCGYCKGDIAAAAQQAGLKSLTIQATDDITGAPKTYTWVSGMKSIQDGE